MSGIEQVQGRIVEIQAAMQALRTPAAKTATASAVTNLSFADTLAASEAAATGSATATATTGLAGAATGQGLVDAAKQYIGVPYVWGGEDPATGLDCSGLVQRAMADLGVDVPRVARDQAKLGTAVASLDVAKAGDLLIFDGGSHIGIYMGGGQMIDAPKPGKPVAVRDVFETPTAIRRVLPEASVAATPSPTALTSAADLQRYALTMMTEATAA